MNKNLRWMTRTALLLALTVVFQLLGKTIPLGPNSQFVVGPLVNACLIIAAVSVGWTGGAVIAVLAPFTALLTGGAIPVLFQPFVSLGNLVLVLFTAWLCRRGLPGIIAGVAMGAVAKFLVLYGSVTWFVGTMTVKPKLAVMMSYMFGWPQLVTAAVGALVALPVVHALQRITSMEKKASA